MNDLAIAHYEQTLSISSKQEMAANNLGVALAKLNLPFLAFKQYKKSIELGGTLAASNLANILIDAGALDDAKAVLLDARRKDEVHQNVFSSSNKLENTKTAERDRRQRISAVAEKHQRFLLAYTNALLSRDTWSFPTGEWTRTTGKEGTVSIKEGSRLAVTWSIEEGEDIFKTSVKYRFQGSLQGRVVSGAIEKFKRDVFAFGKPEAGTFEKYGTGHAFFTGNKLFIAGTNEANDEFQGKNLFASRW